MLAVPATDLDPQIGGDLRIGDRLDDLRVLGEELGPLVGRRRQALQLAGDGRRRRSSRGTRPGARRRRPPGRRPPSRRSRRPPDRSRRAAAESGVNSTRARSSSMSFSHCALRRGRPARAAPTRSGSARRAGGRARRPRPRDRGRRSCLPRSMRPGAGRRPLALSSSSTLARCARGRSMHSSQRASWVNSCSRAAERAEVARVELQHLAPGVDRLVRAHQDLALQLAELGVQLDQLRVAARRSCRPISMRRCSVSTSSSHACECL